jgi:hypothetical protein
LGSDFGPQILQAGSKVEKLGPDLGPVAGDALTPSDHVVLPFAFQDAASPNLTATTMVGPPVGAPRPGVPPPPHACRPGLLSCRLPHVVLRGALVPPAPTVASAVASAS